MSHASPLTPETLLRHEEFVLRLARTLVRGESDAEEVAQRTLASALEKPPKHGAVREWLVRVTRNHATELHRGERRRTEREKRAARSETVEAGTSAMERLELEHGVVRAVLALDEPYRGVVVATYYEGLAPAEIAARRGVPAGTVRSQLTRAHELLRAKLDREHGERGTWMRGMTALLVPMDAPASATASFTVPLVIAAGIAAVVAGVFVARAALAPPPELEMAAVEPAVVPATPVASALGASEPGPARAPIEVAAVAQTVATSAFVPANEPAKLLEQSRQIKQLILGRRLAVTPEERARAGIPADTATSAVVRLLDRTAFGYAFSLPWMREGGSYYSFTERVHDYNRRPQIGFADGYFSPSSDGLVVDLGERSLDDIASTRSQPSGLTPAQGLLWTLARSDAEATNFSNRRERLVQEAESRGEIDAAGARAVRNNHPTARVRHAFLLRAVSSDEFDVLVALEVIAVAESQCTIAYRILESRPVAEPRQLWVPGVDPGVVPPPSSELVRLSEPELLAALASVRTRADAVIYRQFTPEIETRFGSWRDKPDAGLVRLTPYMSEWSELSTNMVGGAHYAFLARSHDAGSGDVSYQGQVGRGELGNGLTGGDSGVFVDLGTTPIESVSLDLVAANGELGAYVVQHAFPHPKDYPAVEPARQQAIRAAQEAERADVAAFTARVRELGSSDRARAIPGRTFALRSIVFESHDVLAAVHVAAEDELGVVIAWKLLKSWPVAPRR